MSDLAALRREAEDALDRWKMGGDIHGTRIPTRTEVIEAFVALGRAEMQKQCATLADNFKYWALANAIRALSRPSSGTEAQP